MAPCIYPCTSEGVALIFCTVQHHAKPRQSSAKDPKRRRTSSYVVIPRLRVTNPVEQQVQRNLTKGVILVGGGWAPITAHVLRCINIRAQSVKIPMIWQWGNM